MRNMKKGSSVRQVRKMGPACMLFVIILVTTLAPVHGSSEASRRTCIDSVTSQIHSLSAAVNSDKALSLAEKSSEVTRLTTGFSSSFYGISFTWSFDANCKVALDDVDVVFSAGNSNGFIGYVIAIESPDLSLITSVIMQNNIIKYPASSNWAGYEFAGSGSYRSMPVFSADASWFVPSVGRPYSGACVSSNCDIAIWPGLVSYPAGSSGIVQTGTDSLVNCASGTCYSQGQAWYEFYPNPPVYCTFNVYAGDSINAQVVSRGVSGGDQTTYDVQLIDNTSNKSCSTTQTFASMGTPYFAEFIAEKAYPTLAQFSTISINGYGMWYSGASHTIYTPYSNGWFTKYWMNNGCGDNTDVGVVDSSGTFTVTWLTSCGT